MTDPTVIRCTDDLLELFRATKDRLGLSNEFVDEIVGLTRGHCDKVLGPTREKRLSPMTFDAFMEVFALEMVVRVNPAAIARMEARWEMRSKDRVRVEPDKLSKRAIRKARPIIFEEMGRIGGLTRNHMLTPKHRSQIARKAANARWKRAGARSVPAAPRAP